MTFFQHLPSSVLQAGAIFLSIIIEALPFVLIGSIIQGLLRSISPPRGSTAFFPRINLGGSSLGPLSALSFLPVNVELSPLSIAF